MTLSREQITEGRRLLDAATEGTWSILTEGWTLTWIVAEVGNRPILIEGGGECHPDADAAAIVWLHNNASDLLDATDALLRLAQPEEPRLEVQRAADDLRIMAVGFDAGGWHGPADELRAIASRLVGPVDIRSDP